MNSELYYKNETTTSRNIGTIDSCNISKPQKKELIKYLEHQIFLYEKDIKNLSKDYKVYYSLIQEEKHKLEVYQDILERVKNGKYD